MLNYLALALRADRGCRAVVRSWFTSYFYSHLDVGVHFLQPRLPLPRRAIAEQSDAKIVEFGQAFLPGPYDLV